MNKITKNGKAFLSIVAITIIVILSAIYIIPHMQDSSVIVDANELVVVDKKETVEKKQLEKIKREPEKVNKLIFGIYLGESLKSLNERKSVIHYLDYNNYNKKWKVIANHPSIIEISVLSYNRNIYEIQISFSDTSDNSYNIMKDELIKKYGPKTNVQFTEEVQGKEIDVDFFSKSIFKSNIDGIEVEIIINRDIGIFSDDTLTVTYIHKSLFNKLHIRNQEINMQKIQNEKNRTINISKEL